MKLPHSLHSHSGAGPRMGLRKKFRLFFTVAAVVLLLSAVKAGIHWLGLELLELNALVTSGIAGAIFILGFLLSSVLSDYKEADRLPAEIRGSLEAIHGDIASFGATNPQVDVGACRIILRKIVRLVRQGLSDENEHSDLQPALDAVSELDAVFLQVEQLGFPANYIVRLRTVQDSLRRSVLRIYHIQRVQFVPSVHILVQTLVASIIVLLLLLKTEGSPESALMFGFICYMFVYALYLIQVLEQPFMKGHDTFDDVSLFLLTEFAERIDGRHQTARIDAATTRMGAAFSPEQEK